MSTSAAPYHHGALRTALLSAAEALLREGGPAVLSLREVARRAGVSHNAPYRHFTDREALLAALATEGFIRLRMALVTARPDGLSGLGRAYLVFARAEPGLYGLMFSGGLRKADHPELMEAGRLAFAELAAAVPVAGSELQRRQRSVGVWALTHGLAQLLAEDQIAAALAEDGGEGILAEILAPLMAAAR